MTNFKEYKISDTLNNSVDEQQLNSEISERLTIVNLVISDVNIICVFEDDLSSEDVSFLDGVISSHAGNGLEVYERLVSDSIDFFNKLMINCAAQNVLDGITQAGKTKVVADYFADVMRYGQSGSLFEVINEINSKLSEGVPSELNPFVTEEKLINLRSKTLEFLGQG